MSSMCNMTDELKNNIKTLFREKKVSQIIGYGQGNVPCTTAPIIMKNDADAEKAVWNSFCVNNLAVYLPESEPANLKDAKDAGLTGIIAKGCDARSITGLIIEGQVQKERLFIIGIPCDGMADRNKIVSMCNGKSIESCAEDGRGIIIVTLKKGGQLRIKKDEVLLDACSECTYPSPPIADIHLNTAPKAAAEPKFSQVKEFELKPIDDRWEYFKQQMSRCIRCYACRQACPNCYCKVCFADQANPGWLGQGNGLSDIMLYHMGRIFHQAGRCVGCDACVRACPMHLDLRLFTQKISKDVYELFGFVPGLSADSTPPLYSFSPADNQDFITDPDTKYE